MTQPYTPADRPDHPQAPADSPRSESAGWIAGWRSQRLHRVSGGRSSGHAPRHGGSGTRPCDTGSARSLDLHRASGPLQDSARGRPGGHAAQHRGGLRAPDWRSAKAARRERPPPAQMHSRSCIPGSRPCRASAAPGSPANAPSGMCTLPGTMPCATSCASRTSIRRAPRAMCWRASVQSMSSGRDASAVMRDSRVGVRERGSKRLHRDRGDARPGRKAQATPGFTSAAVCPAAAGAPAPSGTPRRCARVAAAHRRARSPAPRGRAARAVPGCGRVHRAAR